MSTKLSNGAEYSNSNLPLEFAEYLIQNGFITVTAKDNICFIKDRSVKVFVKQDCMDVFKYTPEHEGNQFPFHQSHTGFSKLNLFGWIMLLHISGVITISEFMSNARRVDNQLATEANEIIRNVIKFQLPTAALSA